MQYSASPLVHGGVDQVSVCRIGLFVCSRQPSSRRSTSPLVVARILHRSNDAIIISIPNSHLHTERLLSLITDTVTMYGKGDAIK